MFALPNVLMPKLMIKYQVYASASLDLEDQRQMEDARFVLQTLSPAMIPKFVVLAEIIKSFLKESVFAEADLPRMLSKFVLHVKA